MEDIKKSVYFFHPYEISFGGYSHSGKTTLISKLIKAFSNKYDVAYVKHDIHQFQMDHEHKDTFKAYESGAKSVFISDPQHYANICSGTLEKVDQKIAFLDSDFALIEGYKRSEIPKIIVIDKEEKILEEVRKGKLKNVLAFVGAEQTHDKILENCPYFHWDNIQEIEAFLISYFNKQVKKIPFYGLVLAGGKSTRMKQDKSLLKYHGKSQVEHCYELLSSCCEQVFISNRQDQSQLDEHHDFSQINDVFLDMGPMGGILSSMRKFPQAAWFVLACDLPFVTKEVVENLFEQRNVFKYATVYQSDHNEFPEPLCGIYEPKIYAQLLKFLGQGYTCPRKILINSNIHMLPPAADKALDNVNHPDEYQKAVDSIQK